MLCRLSDLKHKEVINSNTGSRIGYVDDIEVDTVSASICSIVIYGRYRILGIIGKQDDLIIPWSEIQLIGKDTILVCANVKNRQK